MAESSPPCDKVVVYLRLGFGAYPPHPLSPPALHLTVFLWACCMAVAKQCCFIYWLTQYMEMWKWGRPVRWGMLWNEGMSFKSERCPSYHHRLGRALKHTHACACTHTHLCSPTKTPTNWSGRQIIYSGSIGKGAMTLTEHSPCAIAELRQRIKAWHDKWEWMMKASWKTTVQWTSRSGKKIHSGTTIDPLSSLLSF